MLKHHLGLLLRALILFNLIFITACSAIQADKSVSASPILDRIQNRGELILGTSADQPPLSQLNKQGDVEGLDIDIASMMASSMGVRLAIQVLPFNQLLNALEQGKVDIVLSNVTITPTRNLKVAFVGPYLTSGKCILTKKAELANAGEAKPLNNSKVHIVVQKGTTSEYFARQILPKARLSITEGNEQAIDLVRNNKADAMITDFPICLSAIKNHPDAKFISLFSLLTYEPIGIALPANDALFINWTENFLKRLDDTETLDEMGKHWFGNFFEVKNTSFTM